MGWKLGGHADYWNTLNEPLVQVTNGFANVPGLVEAYWPPGAFSFTGAIDDAAQPRAGEHRRL